VEAFCIYQGVPGRVCRQSIQSILKYDYSKYLRGYLLIGWELLIKSEAHLNLAMVNTFGGEVCTGKEEAQSGDKREMYGSLCSYIRKYKFRVRGVPLC
jgi:hypothetical protein